MTRVLCSYCGFSFMLQANNTELRRWRRWSCRVPICLYEGDLCQLCSPPDTCAAWVDVGIFWLLSKHRSGGLAHSAQLGRPTSPRCPGSERAAGMGGYSKRSSWPEVPGAFCFPFPYLCYSRGQQSFMAPFCCNLHVNDNTAHPAEIPHQMLERMVICELQGISQWIRCNAYTVHSKARQS